MISWRVTNMLQSYKNSSIIITGLIFLMPLFFIPGGAISLGVAKSALMVFGISIAAILYSLELWRSGRFLFPKHPIIYAALIFPVVYFLSALLATPSSLSLFGYSFEAGTFGYMLLVVAVLILSAAVFLDTARSLNAIMAFALSLFFVALFFAVKIIFDGDILVLGNFFGNTGNPLGSWTDLSIIFGLLALLSALAIGQLPMSGAMKAASLFVFLISTALFAVLGFLTAYVLIFVAAAALILYFRKFEPENGMSRMGRFWLPLALGIVSVLLIINPNISDDKKLRGVIGGYFSINNVEVRPSLSATLGVSKAVLSQVALLGSGPNTFSRDWLIYKSANINTTPFWSASFSSGVGFIPTQIATTGILGSAAWLVFLILFLVLCIKALSHLPEHRTERFVLVFSMILSSFLWIASFFYTPAGTLLLLAFIFTGIFLASLARLGIVDSYAIDLKGTSQTRLASTLVLALIVLSVLGIGFTVYKKTLAAYHFNKAVELSNISGTQLSDIESSLIKTINASPADIYFVALSRLNFSRAQIAATSATGTPEQNRAVFEESIRKSIEAARTAVNANPAGYENWIALATVYSALVPKPLAVEGAYENALYAYNEAARRNPNNPELLLLLARLELNKENIDAARSYIRSSLALKQDYADAYLMLAQIETAAGNSAAAIASAENLAILVPDNPGIHFELGLLKYSSRDFSGAVKSLTQALKLSPEYANAKYYLGLTLANLGKFAEAQAELEDLTRTNSDNLELIKALEAIKAKKIPAMPPPVAATPSQQ